MPELITRRCIYEQIYTDSVPRPFGPGYVSMESSECTYEGNIDISGDVICGKDCTAYEPERIDKRPFHAFKGNKIACGIKDHSKLKYDYYPTCKNCIRVLGLEED